MNGENSMAVAGRNLVTAKKLAVDGSRVGRRQRTAAWQS
jgi:hypothetical protein